MKLMKLIIEVDKEEYEATKHIPELYRGNFITAIANGKPYDDSGNLINRDTLKEVINDMFRSGEYDCDSVLKAIDNAPTVDISGNEYFPYRTAYFNGVEDGRATAGSQGECRTCKHRDQEDRKCDCGGQERIGCIFPVRDNYFCKFYEKGGAE